jgi:predicted PurR-regulated permease PerM
MTFLRIPISANPMRRWWCGALVVLLSAWILHSFLHALLAACVTAIASWPLYERVSRRLSNRCGRSVTALLFTLAITLFVLAPLVFAFGALLTEANTLLREIAAADKQGIGVPAWLEHVPFAGSWLAGQWKRALAHPGALAMWAQRADPAALLAWAQSLGSFMVRHLFIVGFTILVLFFLYSEGESVARDARALLRHLLGDRADGYVDLATRAVRASVNSMLIVALFDGVASGTAYAFAGVPRPAMWGAITGALALVPFLGYAAVLALTLQLSMAHATTSAVVSFALGCLILLCGDKIIRPVIARGGVRLPFVWVLMGCLGGFEVLGLIGLVAGPVVLAIARELWQERVRNIALADLMRTTIAAGEIARLDPDQTETVC